MERFNYEFYVPNHEYPEQAQIRFNKGYVFTGAAELPLQRIFTLSFEGLLYFKQGQVFDATSQGSKNILHLEAFYLRHRMDRRFILPHEIYGNLVVRFSAPFVMPKARAGGSGLTEPFQVKMIEHPT